MSRLRILIHNSAWAYGGKAGCQILSAGIAILVIRRMSIESFGVFSFMLTSVLLVQTLSLATATAVFARFVPEFVTSGNKAELRKVLWNGVWFSALVCWLVLGLIFLFRQRAETFFGIEDFEAILPSFAALAFLSFAKGLTESLLRALLLNRDAAMIGVSTTLVRGFFYIFALSRISVGLLLWIEAAVAGMFALQALYSCRRILWPLFLEKEEKQEPTSSGKRIVRYGALAGLNEIGHAFVGRASDYLIVSAMAGAYQLGLYGFAHRMHGMIFQALPAKEFLSILQPLIIQRFSAKNGHAGLADVVDLMIKMLLPLYFIPWLFFVSFGVNLIQYVFKPDYNEAYGVICIMLLVNVLCAFFYPISLAVVLLEKLEFAVYAKGVALFSVGLGIVLMRELGIMGVAIATLFGELSKNYLMFFLLKRHFPMTIRFKELTPYLGAILALLLVGWGLNSLVNSLVGLLGVSVLYVIACAGFSLLFHPFDREELKILKRAFPKSKLADWGYAWATAASGISFMRLFSGRRNAPARGLTAG